MPTISIPLDINALTDPRFGRLAKLLDLVDGDHARGKVEWLWLDCTLRGETELPQWLVEQRLGERGPEAMIEAELATWAGGRGDSKTRRMYIAGSAERLTWYRGKHEQRAKGGKVRASQASRDPAGKYQPQPATAGHQLDTAQPAAASSLTLSLPLTLNQEEEREPARAIPRSTEQAPAPAPTPSVSQAPPSGASAENAISFEFMRVRGQYALEFWSRVDAARTRIAARLGQAFLPFPKIAPSNQPRGFRELQERLREEGEGYVVAAERVFANLVDQAEETKSLEWLSEKGFSSGAWTTARNMQPTKRKAARSRRRDDDMPDLSACLMPDLDTEAKS